MKRVALAIACVLAACGSAMAQPAGDAIRPLVMLTQPQAADPQEFAAAELIVQAWKDLGLDITLRPLPGQQFNQIVWYERQRWDATTWSMVGRPERSDPDELTYNLFVSANIANGYDFVGYNNPAYDKLAQAQREELDLDKRRGLIDQAQELINHDQPYGFMVHPMNLVAINTDVWDEKTVQNQAGIGLRNFWTWLSITPKGSQKDVILNSVAPPTNLNPFNIPGAQGSWATELIWDRLMRIGLDGLPHPWAAETVTRPTPTTVEVTLRDGMKWTDGSPVTIEDAALQPRSARLWRQGADVPAVRAQHRQGRDHRAAHAAHHPQASGCGVPGQHALEAQSGVEEGMGADLRGPQEQAGDRGEHRREEPAELGPVPAGERQAERGDRARAEPGSLG